MGNPVHPDSMETWIARQDLDDAASGWILIEDGLNILSESLPGVGVFVDALILWETGAFAAAFVAAFAAFRTRSYLARLVDLL